MSGPCASSSFRRIGLRTASVFACVVAVLLSPAIAKKKKEDKWISAQSERILVFSNLRQAELSQQLRILDDFSDCLQTAFPELVRKRDTPTFMLIAKDLQTLDQFLPYVEDRLLTVSGLYLPSETHQILLILHEKSKKKFSDDHTILHEYVHEQMLDGAAYPAWAAEGIAEALSHFKTGSGKYTLGRETLMRRLTLYRKQELRMPLWDMFSINVGSRSYRSPHHQQAFYNTSWLFAHYCLISNGRQYRQAYLDLVETSRAKRVVSEDIQRFFGIGLGELNARLVEFASLEDTDHLEIPRNSGSKSLDWNFRTVDEIELNALRSVVLTRSGRIEEANNFLALLRYEKSWESKVAKAYPSLSQLVPADSARPNPTELPGREN